MRTRRIDHVVVATPDAAAAAATFRGHFALAPAPPLGGSPTLQIGGARIAFVTPDAGTTLATALASSGEGLAQVYLEVASLEDAEGSLRQAGVAFTTASTARGRAIAIDPASAHGVRLVLIAGAGQ